MRANGKEDPRYPLNWPFGWKRTPAADRRTSGFAETAEVQRKKWVNDRYETVTLTGKKLVSLRTACGRLDEQLDRLGATDVILSTNVELTLYGEPRGDRRAPNDPGAAVYFKLKGGKDEREVDKVLACDKWNTVAENICAIANHVDAIRRVDRYGVGTMEQVFAGYDALPAPSPENRAPWRGTLGFRPGTVVTVADVNLNYRTLAKKDPTNEYRMLDLNLAREAALRELGDK